MLKKINKLIFKFLFAILLLCAFSLVPTSEAYAASLSLSPGSTTVSVGDIISLKVLVNTGSKYVNNAESTVEFPTAMLEVVSVTKSSSIFTLWVEEPSFSNYTGKITFNGGVPTPGYSGSSGYIATITFKAKKQGQASVLFTDAAVRENDGLGTDILSSKNGSMIQIGIPKVVEVPTPVTINDKSAVPEKPIITSDTHPNQDSWYSKDTANFSWKIPSGVTKIQTSYSKDPNGNPSINYDNSVTQKTLNNLSDGIAYLHLRYFNTTGKSLVAHYRVKIDTVAPKDFAPIVRSEGEKNFIKLDAVDAFSGVDYYMIKIDNNQPIKVDTSALLNDEYLLPALSEGSHGIVVTVYDKAKNSTVANVSFSSSSITSPEVEVNPKEIVVGENVTITGKTLYPNKKVDVTLQFENKDTKKYTQTTDDNGAFLLVTEDIKIKGLVNIWGEVVLSDKVKSVPSKIAFLKVVDTKVISTTMSVIYPLIWIIIIITLIIILLLIIYSGWHKFFGLRRKIKKDLKGTALEVHKALFLLKEELNEQLKVLEDIKVDRELNRKEKIIFNKIKDHIDEIDDYIEKKLDKII